MNFTKVAIAALPPAKPGKRAWYRDEKVRGLYLMVTDKGAKSFYGVRWIAGQNKTEQMKLGPFPDLTVEMARKAAEDCNTRIAKGENPAAEKRDLKADPTFGELFDWWLERHVKPRRGDRYLGELQRQRKGHLSKLSNMKASLITRADVRALHERIGTEPQGKSGKPSPVMANRLLATIRAVYNKAIDHEKISVANPAEGIEAFHENERERRLLPGEISRFLEAVAVEEDADFRDFVLMALFTGIRRSQVMGMRWADVDIGGRTWTLGTTKNGRPQTVPLGDYEIEILSRRMQSVGHQPWVFPGPGKSGHIEDPRAGWDRIRARAGMPDLRLHDLRRTLGSFMADAGVQENVIGRTLNHLSPGATKIYTRLAIDPVRRGKEAGVRAMMEAAKNGSASTPNLSPAE